MVATSAYRQTQASKKNSLFRMYIKLNTDVPFQFANRDRLLNTCKNYCIYMLGSKDDLTTSDPLPSYPAYTSCSQKSYQEELLDKIQIRCSVTFFENRAVYVIMWRNIVEPPQMTVWRMPIPCWIPKATNTHSEYVILLPFVHCNNDCTNAPQCYVICSLAVLL